MVETSLLFFSIDFNNQICFEQFVNSKITAIFITLNTFYCLDRCQQHKAGKLN